MRIRPTFTDYKQFREATAEGDRISVFYETDSAEGSLLKHVENVEDSIETERFTITASAIHKAYMGECGEFVKARIVDT